MTDKSSASSPLQHLGGLAPAVFMQRHWQKKPLLVRNAFELARLTVGRDELQALAARDDLPSRLIRQRAGSWNVQSGPFSSENPLPSPRSKAWTVLVQDVNTQVPALAAVLREFRFLPDARLDDIMVSYATDGGGVGAHLDSYDVFLLQARGTRRWRIAPAKTAAQRALLPDQSLKILANFEPQQSFDLAPGDMLYLPPGYAHDGVAMGECVTYSIGFRAPSQGELLAGLFERMAAICRDNPEFATLYREAVPQDLATESAPLLPAQLMRFVAHGLAKAAPTSGLIEQAVGEYLSEVKAHVWFAGEAQSDDDWAEACTHGIRLSDKSRLLLGDGAGYLNGESFDLNARDFAWWLQLATKLEQPAQQVRKASRHSREIVCEALAKGWINVQQPNSEAIGAN